MNGLRNSNLELQVNMVLEVGEALQMHLSSSTILLTDIEIRENRYIYVACVDFKKAYDWVNRDLLWDCLARLGVRDPYLSVLRSMYNNHVVLQVRLHGWGHHWTPRPFPSLVGVKQVRGSPIPTPIRSVH